MPSIQTFLLFALTTTYVNAQRLCNKGEYLATDNDGTERCRPCPSGMYFPQDGHRNVDCARCATAFYQRQERLLKECTPTSNAVVGCKDGYFRQSNYHPMSQITLVSGYCLPCKTCPENTVEIVPCSLFSDTFCCPQYEAFGSVPRENTMEVRCRG